MEPISRLNFVGDDAVRVKKLMDDAAKKGHIVNVLNRDGFPAIATSSGSGTARGSERSSPLLSRGDAEVQGQTPRMKTPATRTFANVVGGSSNRVADRPLASKQQRVSYSTLSGSTVEDYVEAAIKKLGKQSVVSAGRLDDRYTHVYVKTTEMGERLRVEAIEVNGEQTVALRLGEGSKRPPTRLTLVRVLPEIPNRVIMDALSKFCVIESRIMPINLKGHSEVVSFRRQVFVSLREDIRIPHRLFLKGPEGSHEILVFGTGPNKCFRCGSEDHLVRECPEEAGRGGPPVGPRHSTPKRVPTNRPGSEVSVNEEEDEIMEVITRVVNEDTHTDGIEDGKADDEKNDHRDREISADREISGEGLEDADGANGMDHADSVILNLERFIDKKTGDVERVISAGRSSASPLAMGSREVERDVDDVSVFGPSLKALSERELDGGNDKPKQEKLVKRKLSQDEAENSPKVLKSDVTEGQETEMGEEGEMDEVLVEKKRIEYYMKKIDRIIEMKNEKKKTAEFVISKMPDISIQDFQRWILLVMANEYTTSDVVERYRKVLNSLS